MTTDVRDSPIEQRVADLRFIRRPEEAEELEFLEDYLRWKSTGGPEKLAEKQNEYRKLEMTRTLQECHARKKKRENSEKG